MIDKSSKNQGFIYYLAVAIIAIIGGIALHVYNQNIDSYNHQVNNQYQLEFKTYTENNIYYEPLKTIAGIASRQNDSGYFVINPDLINEPSQLNANSLRATRYAIAALAELDGLGSINTDAVVDFLLNRYKQGIDSKGAKFAGFATLQGEQPGVRPTMDAILTLQALSALANDRIDLVAIQNFILNHQNEDGGFWDPHYPKYQQVSCLKCTSFAFRALGAIQKHTGEKFSSEFINKMTHYIQASWDNKNQSYSGLINSDANDSYDIFRSFIILWNLNNESDARRALFTNKHLNIDEINNTVSKNYKTDNHVYSRKTDTNQASMKATHLLTWMYHHLGKLDQVNIDAVNQYVLSNQSSPGEYGGDIYNTYSAIGLFTKLDTSTESLVAPKKPLLKKSYFPDFLSFILYGFAALLVFIYGLNNKKHLEKKAKNLERKASKDKLTGLFNRSYLEDAYAYHSSTDEQISLILIDVDKFKNINDTFGHLTGDTVLQALSTLIGGNIRNTDILARWGGEEFAILCPATAGGAAQIFAEKLRTLVEQHPFDTINSLTCSFGISTSNNNDDLQSLFQRADKGLYQSKTNGRNKVTIAA